MKKIGYISLNVKDNNTYNIDLYQNKEINDLNIYIKLENGFHIFDEFNIKILINTLKIMWS